MADRSMGGMNSQLLPTALYRELQPLFVQAQREERGTYSLGLDLTVQLAEGVVLDPVGGITVLDLEEEMGEIGVDLGAWILDSSRAVVFPASSSGDDGTTTERSSSSR